MTRAAGMGPHEAALAGLHADAVALLMRLELAAGQAQQQAAGQRRHQALTLSLDKRKSQSAIWGKQTAAQQRLDRTKMQKVGPSLIPSMVTFYYAGMLPFATTETANCCAGVCPTDLRGGCLVQSKTALHLLAHSLLVNDVSAASIRQMSFAPKAELAGLRQ